MTTVDFIIKRRGAYLVHAECGYCKNVVQSPDENRFNFCPYCGRRVKYKEENNGN